MPYCIAIERPVAEEMRRIVRKQLRLAITELSAAAAPSDGTVHDARRHIKKARAALRLCRDAVRPSYRSSNRRLRRATRLLAPIADGEAVVRAFAALAAQHAAALPRAAVAAMQRYLEDRQAAIDRHAARHRVLRRVVVKLKRERDEARRYPLDGDEYDLLAPGFERTLRRSRAAMTRAIVCETAGHYHDWRRRVKDHWLQVRLLSVRCGGRLSADAQQLDQLDALLGSCHDLALLTGIVRDAAPLSRAHAAACLRVIRREQWAQRRRAVALGHAVYDEPSSASVDRAARAWRPAAPDAAAAGVRRPGPRAA